MGLEQLMNLEFTAYVGLAVVLYAIREAENVPNRYIPLIAIVLGVLFSGFEASAFNFTVLLTGLQYALLGVGTIASIKYVREKRGN